MRACRPLAAATVPVLAVAAVIPAGSASASVASQKAARAATATAPSLLGKVIFESNASLPSLPTTGSVTPSGHGYDIYAVNRDGSHLRRLTHVGYATGPDLSPDGRTLAYVQSDDSVWTVHTDGSHARQLATCPLDCQLPRWSPDGKRIAFVTVANSKDPHGDIIIMRADGTHVHRFRLGTAYALTWSPKGRRLAFSTDAFHRGLFILNVGTGSVHRIYRDPRSASLSPAWSPRGGVILFSDNENLFTVRVDGTHVHQLTGRPGHVLNQHPLQYTAGGWAPRGGLVAMDIFDDHNGNSSVGIMWPDGTHQKALFTTKADAGDAGF